MINLNYFFNLRKNDFIILKNNFLIKNEKIKHYQRDIQNRFEEIYLKNLNEEYEFVFLNNNEEIESKLYTNLTFRRNLKNKKNKFIDNYIDSYYDNIYIINKSYDQKN